jgi:hypothetical protein
MNFYKYKAFDKLTFQEFVNFIRANNEIEAQSLIHKKGMSVISIIELKNELEFLLEIINANIKINLSNHNVVV